MKKTKKTSKYSHFRSWKLNFLHPRFKKKKKKGLNYVFSVYLLIVSAQQPRINHTEGLQQRERSQVIKTLYNHIYEYLCTNRKLWYQVWSQETNFQRKLQSSELDIKGRSCFLLMKKTKNNNYFSLFNTF